MSAWQQNRKHQGSVFLLSLALCVTPCGLPLAAEGGVGAEIPATETASEPEQESAPSPASDSSATNPPDAWDEQSDAWGQSWLDGFAVFASLRLRPEYRSNFDFNRSTDDQADFVGQRAQVGVAKEFNEDLRLRITLQDSRVWGGSPGSDSGLSTANSESNESLDLREAYLEWNRLLGPLGIRAGRQILAYGDGRLVGAADWSNVGRSFDAMRLHIESDRYRAQLFAAVLAEEDSDDAGNQPATGARSSDIIIRCDENGAACRVSAGVGRELDDAYFAGFHNSFQPANGFLVEAYYFGVYKKWMPAATPRFAIPGATVTTQDRARQRDNLHTIGLRLTNRDWQGRSSHALDWTAEAMMQSGETGRRVGAGWDPFRVEVPLFDAAGAPLLDANGVPQQRRLWTEPEQYAGRALALSAGWTFFERLRLGAEYIEASGDRDRSDAESRTFQPLFPDAHEHLGWADRVSMRNILARSANLSWDFGAWGKLKIQVWRFVKRERADAYYDARGLPRSGLSTEAAGNARYGPWILDGQQVLPAASLGQNLFREYDLLYSIRVRGLLLGLGYSAIFAEDSIALAVDRRNLPLDQQLHRFDRRADFAYLILQAQF
ncbi:MAG: alginate export family protein [Leptospirales bacterium]|nr:alginate export family protein [Leptospirales bacterium]